jgi:hypothetical protein
MMYSYVEGRMSFIAYFLDSGFNFELRLPVVRALKANSNALLPIAPSLSIISMFLMSSVGIVSGHPP